MNVLFYFGGFAPLGGIETSARNLLCDLKKRNFDVRLVCWGAGSRLLEELQRTGVHVKRACWRWGCRFNLPDWLMLPVAIQALREADVVLFGKLVPKGILLIVRRLAREDARFILVTPYRPHVPETEMSRRTTLDLYDAYDCIWVQSALFKADLQAIGYRKRVDVIPYMPEPTRPVKPYPTRPIRIGFLGRLVEDKNLPLLFEAFHLFRKRVFSGSKNEPVQAPELELYGDGELRPDLEVMARQLGIGSYVRFHGAVPQQQVAEVVPSCHLFVFTSRFEGQCLAALEILGCGRPIVATGAGAFPDILRDARLGRLVAGSSSAEMVANAIGQVVALIAAGEMTPGSVQSAYAEAFGAEGVGERYVQLLHACRGR